MGSCPVFVPDLVRIGSSIDRERIRTLAAELRRLGITSVMLPSVRCIGVWDLEVPADAVGAARAILAGVAPA